MCEWLCEERDIIVLTGCTVESRAKGQDLCVQCAFMCTLMLLLIAQT